MTRPFYPTSAYVLTPPDNLRSQHLTDVEPGVYAAVCVKWPSDGYGGRPTGPYSKPSRTMCRVVVEGKDGQWLRCHSDSDLIPSRKPSGALRTPTHNDWYGPDADIPADETFWLAAVCCTWDHWISYCAQIEAGWHAHDQAEREAHAQVTRDRLTDFGLHPRDDYPTIEVDAPALQTFLDSYETVAELRVRLSELEQELEEAKRVAA